MCIFCNHICTPNFLHSTQKHLAEDTFCHVKQGSSIVRTIQNFKVNNQYHGSWTIIFVTKHICVCILQYNRFPVPVCCAKTVARSGLSSTVLYASQAAWNSVSTYRLATWSEWPGWVGTDFISMALWSELDPGCSHLTLEYLHVDGTLAKLSSGWLC